MEDKIQDKQHSVKLTKGMNGDYSWEIKIYFDDYKSPYKVIEDIEGYDKDMRSKFNSPRGNSLNKAVPKPVDVSKEKKK